jgi:glycosyltransferase involved in cell wall biosynthesis
MPAYLNASDLYVSSSLSDGTSLSLLEAMACGLPVVVTDVPAILEWVVNGENGLVVPRRSIDELAEAIIYLLQREDVRKEMGEKNIAIAKERADWDKNFKKLEDIYETLVYGGTK